MSLKILDKTKFKSVNCDICGSNEKIQIGIPDISKVVNQNINIPDKLFVVRCKDCGFYYTDPMPFWGEEDLNKLYDSQYFPEHTELWRKIREELNPNRRLDLAEKIYKSKISNFLEIGCGCGLAMRQANKRGWNVYGQDVSLDFAKVVKKDLNVDIFVGQLEEAKYSDGFFDLIYLDSVIEHVPQPSKLIKEIYRILKPGGLVYIVCPNEDSLSNFSKQLEGKFRGRNISSRISPFCNPYHIGGFNKKTLKMLALRNFFDVKYIFTRKDYRASRFKKYSNNNLANLNWKGKVYEYGCTFVYLIGNFIGMGTNLEIALSAKK